ncbi:facilitated trehalose transporter Tret1-2 homolog [Agrilus planipennis]|uniref:Facilitated trehalose transporter Tret1-2 homolog n=1 Tax=Agrilus planipennis TaxID=224129 RepID=A0A1W4XJX1_AGRPL|nr:facilitated trehalose transporter Tret1-2 homolog [Agrilus planipennis]
MGSEDRQVGYIPVAREDPTESHKGNGIELQSFGKLQSLDKLAMGVSIEPTNRKFLYAAALTVNISSFVAGITFGWTSPMIPKLNGQEDPHLNPVQPPITPTDESWIGSLLPLGAGIGPFAAGFFLDRIGRKKTLLASNVPFLVAFIMFAVCSEVKYFYIGRFLCGVAVGGIFTALPMYVAEISDDAIRGTLVSFFELFMVAGLLFAYAVGPYISMAVFNYICAVLSCIFMAVFFVFIPESPYHLVAIKDDKAASEALAKFRAKSENAVQKELFFIKGAVEEAMANNANFFDIFKSKGATKALIISVSLVSLQQFSGIIVILFYSQTIFAATGSTIPPELSTIMLGTVQVLGCFIPSVSVDRWGKRSLLIISGVGMGLAEGVLGYYFYLKMGGSNVQPIFWLPVACMIIFIVAYSTGFGPLPWAVSAELFTSDVKSSASTATVSICWLLGFVLTKFFAEVSDAIGISNSFYIFGLCCLIAALFVYKFLPETSGKSLQEIQDILNGVSKDNVENAKV